jgi:hypothetical protein
MDTAFDSGNPNLQGYPGGIRPTSVVEAWSGPATVANLNGNGHQACLRGTRPIDTATQLNNTRFGAHAVPGREFRSTAENDL